MIRRYREKTPQPQEVEAFEWDGTNAAEAVEFVGVDAYAGIRNDNGVPVLLIGNPDGTLTAIQPGTVLSRPAPGPTSWSSTDFAAAFDPVSP
ncbi:hypothetical protein GCM10009530_26650 [Microbispora corallina]|uniref:Uncharacterized protein n=1 Tax=Microbispora corallina TaxID=83302 RepID=A0ABQ4G4Y8_9ACTN|nr:hypothetical protein [Microbispora corallina]GIH42146.1 hypothetical protein Mco01_51460 [Microbispora corallina]